MHTLRHYLGRIRRWFRVRLFANNQSLTTNLLYSLYHLRCRRAWRRPSAHSASASLLAAQALRAEGYKVFSPTMDPGLIRSICAKVDDLFDHSGDAVQISQGLFRLRDGLEQVPQIVDFMTPEIEQAAEQYFGSHFKIFGVYFYRTMPADVADTSSFLWHLDNCPRQEIKLMVYLDDTTAERGAFRLKPVPLSNEMKAQGFWDREQIERFHAALEDTTTTKTLEGPAGTSFLFQNGGCIHKATFPLRTHRDVTTFILIPSTIPWRVHFARNRHLLSTNCGVCLNPFTDRPQSVGYLQ
jgi:hypothetical protein